MSIDFSTISQVIANLGFPIVCAAALFWFLNEERKSHVEESEKWREIVDKNTEALVDLREVVATLKGMIERE